MRFRDYLKEDSVDDILAKYGEEDSLNNTTQDNDKDVIDFIDKYVKDNGPSCGIKRLVDLERPYLHASVCEKGSCGYFLSLSNFIKAYLRKNGYNSDLNFIDVSTITNMSYLFSGRNKLSLFNGDISKWDVSNVTDMDRMFENSHFNGDISKWDVSNVTFMYGAFEGSMLEKLGKIPSWYKP